MKQNLQQQIGLNDGKDDDQGWKNLGFLENVF